MMTVLIREMIDSIGVTGELCIGEIDAATEGQLVEVSTRDENGMPIKIKGIVTEILED